MNVTADKVTLSLVLYSKSFIIAVCTLNLDVILGKKWCSRHKAKIDCEKNIIRRTRRHGIFTIHALANSDSEISVIAIGTKFINNQIFAITLQAPDKSLDPILHIVIKALLNYSQDVFQKRYPLGFH